MSIADQLKQWLAEQHSDQSPYEKGLELGLPPTITAVKIDSGKTSSTVMSVQSLLDQLGSSPTPSYIHLFLAEKGDEWYFTPHPWPCEDIHFPLCEWWPVFVDAAIRAWIKAIPTTYANLDLTELITLTRHLGWCQRLGDAPQGGWSPNDRVRIENGLWVIAHNWHARVQAGGPDTSWVELNPKSSTTIRSYKILDIRWIPVFKALIQRLQNLTVIVPAPEPS
ncbi:MAG: hypothetical protein NTZ65_00695 [Candidatus Berkelbacteria bacterium]|nr:hypothetical protein [Candidatus Berkelbacteria bacterium]